MSFQIFLTNSGDLDFQTHISAVYGSSTNEKDLNVVVKICPGEEPKNKPGCISPQRISEADAGFSVLSEEVAGKPELELCLKTQVRIKRAFPVPFVSFPSS